jgi:hypothetical protein
LWAICVSVVLIASRPNIAARHAAPVMPGLLHPRGVFHDGRKSLFAFYGPHRSLPRSPRPCSAEKEFLPLQRSGHRSGHQDTMRIEVMTSQKGNLDKKSMGDHECPAAHFAQVPLTLLPRKRILA